METTTATPRRTFLVECFVPPANDAAIADAHARIRSLVGPDASGAEAAVAYLGALVIADDEVVFHLFRAPVLRSVRDLLDQAGVAFERIVESVVVGMGADDPLATHRSRP